MKIAVVSGGFDPIHSGHISYLKSAKEKADHLIVALNSDDWLIKKKKKVSINKLYDEVSKAVLGSKAAKKPGSAKRLRKELGYSKNTGFLQFLIQRSQRKMLSKDKGGELFVRYC